MASSTDSMFSRTEVTAVEDCLISQGLRGDDLDYAVERVLTVAASGEVSIAKLLATLNQIFEEMD